MRTQVELATEERKEKPAASQALSGCSNTSRITASPRKEILGQLARREMLKQEITAPDLKNLSLVAEARHRNLRMNSPSAMGRRS
mmetsp:Transcript_45904/g.85641  ORF Transcript_45904/g.85641 Transcript_45904/m.85641 type:complete len:85 (+) Transcript_45904:74-328(+)